MYTRREHVNSKAATAGYLPANGPHRLWQCVGLTGWHAGCSLLPCATAWHAITNDHCKPAIHNPTTPMQPTHNPSEYMNSQPRGRLTPLAAGVHSALLSAAPTTSVDAVTRVL